MKITKYKPNKSLLPELITLIQDKYKDKKNFDYFFSDYQKAYSFCVDNENILFIPIAAFKNEQLIAHIALINDRRLPKSEAFFGFFEIQKDITVLEEIWECLLKEAKKQNIKILKGPVNGSIWHQYRCIKETDESEYFKTEPISEIYYYELLSQMKPEREISYYSASREKFDKVMRIIHAGFEKLATAGFEIKKVKDVTFEQLHAIAEISRNVFSKNSWGYTDLTEKEFLQLYSFDKLQQHLNNLYLLLKDQQIIGFCGTTTESEQILILKTICILPECQGLGLGNALVYQIHLDAQKAGFKKMIYALIREGNQIKNFPKDDTVIFRRYAAFEFRI